METIGQRIRFLRELQGLSMSKLGEFIDTKSSVISNWENDKKTPSASMIVALSQFFGVSTDWILTGKDSKLSDEKLKSLSNDSDSFEETDAEMRKLSSEYQRLVISEGINDGVGGRIRELRISKGLSMTKLGNAIGVSSGNVSDWENGRTKPTLTALDSLSRFFGVSIDWLVKGEDSGTERAFALIEEGIHQLEEKQNQQPSVSSVIKSWKKSAIEWLKNEDSFVDFGAGFKMAHLFSDMLHIAAGMTPHLPPADESEKEAKAEPSATPGSSTASESAIPELSAEEHDLLAMFREFDEKDRYEILMIAQMKRAARIQRGMSSSSTSREDAATSESRKGTA